MPITFGINLHVKSVATGSNGVASMVATRSTAVLARSSVFFQGYKRPLDTQVRSRKTTITQMTSRQNGGAPGEELLPPLHHLYRVYL